MKISYTIYWIDDDSIRKPLLGSLAEFEASKHPQVNAEFFNVRGKKLVDSLEEILNKSQPDLVIVDQILDKTSQPSVLSRGSTVARIIREKWPECPIVGITAARSRSGVKVAEVLDHDKESEFEDLYAADEFSDHFSTLFVLAGGFRKLATARLKTVDQLVHLLNPPNGDVVRLKSVVPTDLKDNWSDVSVARRVSSWIRHSIMGKPGFLYNREWTATLIGLKPEAYGKVEHLFVNAKYNGIFADNATERWWPSSIRELLFELVPESGTNLPWVAGHNLPRIKTSDQSSCYVCGKLYPEILGYPDTRNKSWKPMHLACSQPHPQYEASLFFDQIRIMGDSR